MALDVGQVIGGAISAWLSIIAGFAAISATRAAEEDDRQNMTARVSRTVSFSTLGLGCLGLVGAIVALYSGGTDSGMMTRGGLSFFMVIFGLAGVIGLWVGALVMGFVGCAVAKNLPPLLAGLAVFACTSLGAPAFFVLSLLGRLVPHQP
jgi:hypothetical protein